MKKLQLIVYLILLAGFVTAYNQGFDRHEKESYACAVELGAPYNQYNKYLYWHDGVCCQYSLEGAYYEEKRIVEVCK